MAQQFNYSFNPSTNDIDAVRFLCQDTDETEGFLDDREIQYLLDQKGTPERAAAAAARKIAQQLSLLPDIKTGLVTISNKDRARYYIELAENLENEAGLSAAPYAGGISISDKESQEQDSDRVKPFFIRNVKTISTLAGSDDEADEG